MSEELVKRLRNLDVSQYSEGHPFGLLAEAAATIERLARERDHWKDYSSGQGRLIESGVFVSNDDYSKLIAAESELAKAREALDEAKLVAVELQRTNDAWVRQDKALSAELAKVTRERDAAQVMDRLQGARAVAAESELAKAKEALIRIANENYEPIDGSFTMAAAAIADAALPPKPEDKP
jgi:hypothetical protein